MAAAKKGSTPRAARAPIPAEYKKVALKARDTLFECSMMLGFLEEFHSRDSRSDAPNADLEEGEANILSHIQELIEDVHTELESTFQVFDPEPAEASHG